MKNVALMVFSGSMGGAESVVKEIIKNISKKNLNLFLITNDEIINNFLSLIDKKNIFSVGSLFNNNLFFKILNRLSDRKKNILNHCVRDAVSFIEKNNIAIVHAHLGLDLFLLSKIKKKLNSRLFAIYTVHGSLGLDPNFPYKSFFDRKSILKQLESIDCYTSACKYFLNLLRINKIDVDPKSIIIENGINKNISNNYFRDVNGDKKNLYLVYLGGSRFLKGPDILLGALNILINKYNIKNLRLNVLRDIAPRSSFRGLANDLKVDNYIKYIGYIPSPGHLKYINDSDIFVLPSRTEGIANTLMEAIGFEKPIVATDVGGTSELVWNGKNGLLCSPRPEDLAQKLIFLIKNKALRDIYI